MDVFDSSGPAVPFDEATFRAQLQAYLRTLSTHPRKARVGYQGRVIPLVALPLVVGLGDDGAYKLLDLRELLDGSPDIVWHAWIRIDGSDLAPGRPATVPDKGGRADPLSLLDAFTGGGGSGGRLLFDVIRRIVDR